MSGTSLDGIDVAFIKSDGTSVERLYQPFHLAYSPQEKQQLTKGLEQAKKEIKPTHNNDFINQLEELVTVLHVKAVRSALEINALQTHDIDIIGFHGQTLLHKPDQGWSWQIGSGKNLSNQLNMSVVNDFRRYDVEHGGQGAPLVPIYHQALLKNLSCDYPVAFVNIGGVANMTWIGGQFNDDILAFDTGPGNALIDDWVRSKSDLIYDKDGIFSAKGKVDQTLLKQWLDQDYFSMLPPKSLDRDQFDVSDIKSLNIEDGAATLCAFSAHTIKKAQNLCPKLPKTVFICGGGVHNPTIMNLLQSELSGEVASVNDLGLNGDFIEAEAFAYLAIRSLYDLPITFPGTTAISKPSSGGVFNSPD